MVLLVGVAVAVEGIASDPLQPSDESSIDILASHKPADPGSSGGHPEYVAFVLFPVFFIMGLLGVLICHLLKKKGYRCTTEAESPVEEEKIAEEKIELRESIGDANNDTVGQIVNYIMKNEANADVLKALVADNSVIGDNSVFDPESPATPYTPGTPMSPGSPLSPNATPSKHTCRGHLHTVGGVVESNACTRCSQKRWHLLRAYTEKHKKSKKVVEAQLRCLLWKLLPARFRVTKVEPKSKERKNLASDSEVPSTPISVGIGQRSGTETEITLADRRAVMESRVGTFSKHVCLQELRLPWWGMNLCAQEYLSPVYSDGWTLQLLDCLTQFLIQLENWMESPGIGQVDSEISIHHDTNLEPELSAPESYGILLDPSPPPARRRSPPEGLSFMKFIQQMGNALPIKLESDSEPSSELFEALDFDDVPKELLKLPLHNLLKEAMFKNWKTPLFP
uniref:LOW QUALITY PROTEIN: RELT-like protein 1 n=1 Tax=Geotrypetes seraphini TaxID=260995 RepID=A0A6P8SDW2_GEOSA|nr:LOW QUALITY PROTEIN: RELT-like protein 1 [Geotrypetes seraphini]